ncbi:MAG TPA: hypothetical protein VEK08_26470 [Planctomycetota bacterium]|nr:hypothetical protein [Planctomycetota bacterium]
MKRVLLGLMLILALVGSACAEETTATRSLKQVLDYFSAASRLNVRAANEALEKQNVTLQPELIRAADWRPALQHFCAANDLRIDERKLAERVLIVWQPVKVSLDVQNADVRSVIWSIAEQARINVVLDPDVKGEVTLKLKSVAWDTALNAVVRSVGLTAVQEEGVTRIKP